MTEEEYLSTFDDAAMGRHLLRTVQGASPRKWRLYHCALLDNLWESAGFPNRHAVNAFLLGLVEQGTAGEEGIGAADRFFGHLYHEGLRDSLRFLSERGFQSLLGAARLLAGGEIFVAEGGPSHEWFLLAGWPVSRARLLLEVFGNPFRSRRFDPAWAAWEEGTVVRLAEATYDDRAFERLSVLSDALEEAGCTDAELLSHLRSPGPHERGCWALDLVLGKE